MLSPEDLLPLFSEHVSVAVEGLEEFDLERGLAALYDDELEHVAAAVAKRQREFACGRALARRALAKLGDRAASIGVGAKREPVWPVGRVGSISHTRGVALAAVARADRVRTLGVDVEPAEELPDRLRERILTAAELAAGEASEVESGLRARMAFSAKESVYKAQFPLTRAWLDFHAVEVDFEPSGEFRARFETAPEGGVIRPGTVWGGRWVQRGGYVVTAIELPA